MTTAVYPGSFDPVTVGHLDIIDRASKIFDRLVIGVLINGSKRPLFTLDERVSMIRQALSAYDNIEVMSFSGLTVDFARRLDASVMVRGLRAVTDFDYELQLAQTNKKLAPDIETVFLSTSLQYAYLSSSIVKDVASYHGDISAFVPDFVAEKIYEKLSE